MARQHRLNNTSTIRKIVDICLVILIILVMSYEVTGDMWHEWAGIAGTLVVFIHIALNYKWFAVLFKGKYGAMRIALTVTDLLLIASFLLTAFCGMAMSIYAVPFLYGIAPMSFVRRTHLAMSYWAFAFAGIHLGLHAKVISGMFKIPTVVRRILTVIVLLIGIYGAYLIVTGRTFDYMFFKIPFAIIDAEKPAALVLFNGVSMLASFACVGMGLGQLFKERRKKD